VEPGRRNQLRPDEAEDTVSGCCMAMGSDVRACVRARARAQH
jgi:hypothetical protein